MKRLVMIFVLALAIPMAVCAQGSAFSFQGRLNDGANPANGAYDLEFRLFQAIQGGTPIGNMVVQRPNTALINGVFSVMLDFGATAFNNPSGVFIEISVKPNGSPNAFTILGPRQQLTVVPYAVRAASAANADNATNAQNAVSATNAFNANTLNGLTFGEFILNQTNPQPNSSFNISGNGFIGGKLSLVGDTVQNRDRGGFVKAMVFVDAPNGKAPFIVRCFNGVTGVSTGTCGFTVQSTYYGKYLVDFGFPVNDRFYSVTAQQFAAVDSGYNITTGFFFPSDPNQVGVKTNIADKTYPQSMVDSQFMLIVF